MPYLLPATTCCYSSFPSPLFHNRLRSLQHLFGMPYALLAVEETTGMVSVLSLVQMWSGYTNKLLRHNLIPGSATHPITSVDTLPFPSLSFFGNPPPLSHSPSTRMNTMITLSTTRTVEEEGLIQLLEDQEAQERGEDQKGNFPTTSMASSSTTSKTATLSFPSYFEKGFSNHLIVAVNMQEVLLFRCAVPPFLSSSLPLSSFLLASLFSSQELRSVAIGKWTLPHISTKVSPLVHFFAWRRYEATTRVMERGKKKKKTMKSAEKKCQEAEPKRADANNATGRGGGGRSGGEGEGRLVNHTERAKTERSIPRRGCVESNGSPLHSFQDTLAGYDGGEGCIRVGVTTEEGLHILEVTIPPENKDDAHEDGGSTVPSPVPSPPPLRPCFFFPSPTFSRIIGIWGVGGSATTGVVVDVRGCGGEPLLTASTTAGIPPRAGEEGENKKEETKMLYLSASRARREEGDSPAPSACCHTSGGVGGHATTFTMTLVDVVEGVIMERHLLPYAGGRNGLGVGNGDESFPLNILLGPRLSHRMFPHSSLMKRGEREKKSGKLSVLPPPPFASTLFGRRRRSGEGKKQDTIRRAMLLSSFPPLTSRMGVLVFMKDLFVISAVLLTWKDRLDKWIQHAQFPQALEFIRDLLLGVEHSVHGWGPLIAEDCHEDRRGIRKGGRERTRKRGNCSMFLGASGGLFSFSPARVKGMPTSTNGVDDKDVVAVAGGEENQNDDDDDGTSAAGGASFYKDVLTYFEVVTLSYVEHALRQPRVSMKAWKRDLYDVVSCIISYSRDTRMQFTLWHRVFVYLREQYPLRCVWRSIMRAIGKGVASGIISTVPTAYVPAVVESLLYGEEWETEVTENRCKNTNHNTKEDEDADDEEEKEERRLFFPPKHGYHHKKGGKAMEKSEEEASQGGGDNKNSLPTAVQTVSDGTSLLLLFPLHSSRSVVSFPSAAARARAESVLLPLRGDLHALYQLGRQYHLRRLTLHILVYYWKQYPQALQLSLLEDEWERTHKEDIPPPPAAAAAHHCSSSLLSFITKPGRCEGSLRMSLSPSSALKGQDSPQPPPLLPLETNRSIRRINMMATFPVHQPIAKTKGGETPEEEEENDTEQFTPQLGNMARLVPPPHQTSSCTSSFSTNLTPHEASLLGSHASPVLYPTPTITTLDFLSQLFRGESFVHGQVLSPLEGRKAQHTLLVQLYNSSGFPPSLTSTSFFSSSMRLSSLSSPMHALLRLHPVRATQMLLSAVCRCSLEEDGESAGTVTWCRPSPALKHPLRRPSLDLTQATTTTSSLALLSRGVPPGLFATRLLLHLLFLSQSQDEARGKEEQVQVAGRGHLSSPGWAVHPTHHSYLQPQQQGEEEEEGESLYYIDPLSPMEISLFQPSQFIPLFYKMVRWGQPSGERVKQSWYRTSINHPYSSSSASADMEERNVSTGWENGGGGWTSYDGRKKTGAGMEREKGGSVTDALGCFSSLLLQYYAGLPQDRGNLSITSACVKGEDHQNNNHNTPTRESTPRQRNDNHTAMYFSPQAFLPILVQLTIFLYQHEADMVMRRELEQRLGLYFRSPSLENVDLRLWQRKCEAAGLRRSAAAISFRDGRYGEGIDYYLLPRSSGPHEGSDDEEEEEEEEEEELQHQHHSDEDSKAIKEWNGLHSVDRANEEEGGRKKSRKSYGYGNRTKRYLASPDIREAEQERVKEIFEVLQKEMGIISLFSVSPKRISTKESSQCTAAQKEGRMEKGEGEKKKRMDALYLAVIDRVVPLGRLHQPALVSFYIQHFAQKEKTILAALGVSGTGSNSSSRKLLHFLEHLIHSQENAVRGNAYIQNQYLELMCLHAPERVYPYLRTHEGSINYDHSAAMQCCRKYHLFSATIFLLFVSHQLKDALIFTCGIMKKLLWRCRRAITEEEEMMYQRGITSAGGVGDGKTKDAKKKRRENERTSKSGKNDFLNHGIASSLTKVTNPSSSARIRARVRSLHHRVSYLRSSSSLFVLSPSQLEYMSTYTELFEVLELGVKIGQSLNTEEAWLLLIDLFHLPEGFYAPSSSSSSVIAGDPSPIPLSSSLKHKKGEEEDEGKEEKRKRQQHHRNKIFFELYTTGLAVVILGLSSSLGSATLFRQLLRGGNRVFSSLFFSPVSPFSLPLPALSRWCFTLPRIFFLVHHEVELYKVATTIAEWDGMKWVKAYLVHSRRGVRENGKERERGKGKGRGSKDREEEEGKGREKKNESNEKDTTPDSNNNTNKNAMSSRGSGTTSTRTEGRRVYDSGGCGICHQPLGSGGCIDGSTGGVGGMGSKENQVIYIYSCSHAFHQVCLGQYAQYGNNHDICSTSNKFYPDRDEAGEHESCCKNGLDIIQDMAGPFRIRCPVCVGALIQGNDRSAWNAANFLLSESASLGVGMKREKKRDGNDRGCGNEGYGLSHTTPGGGQEGKSSGRALATTVETRAEEGRNANSMEGMSWTQYYARIKKLRNALNKSGDRTSGMKNILCSLPPPIKVRKKDY